MAHDNSHSSSAIDEQQMNHPLQAPSDVDKPAIAVDQAALEAFIREHPHLKEASAEWQIFYYRIRAAVLAER